MRLRYHVEKQNCGLLLLEAEPQVRRIFIYSQSTSNKQIPFPYILFSIRYEKSNGQYIYRGVYGSGLTVFFRNESISSVNDEVFFSPTDMERKGLVCTEHSSDNKNFKSVVDLAQFVITSWWGHCHVLCYQYYNYDGPDRSAKNVYFPDGGSSTIAWSDTSLEKIKEVKWIPAGSYHCAMKIASSMYSGNYHNDGIENISLIDEPWMPKQNIILPDTIKPQEVQPEFVPKSAEVLRNLLLSLPEPNLVKKVRKKKNPVKD